jgi:mono/diheme cytochrome c family protein
VKRTPSIVVALFIALALSTTSCSGTEAADDGSIPSVPIGLAPGDPLAGAQLYRSVCASCHGENLAGVVGLGRELVPSSFIANMSEDDLVAFIIEGRPIDHPDNLTGVAMLPRVGNPSLSNQDIANIVAYIKAQQ